MRLHLSMLFPSLLLAACANQPATELPAGGGAAACNATSAQGYVGQMATDATLDAIRRATGARQLRALQPGQAATMDYREDRVNVLQDAAGAIERITCG